MAEVHARRRPRRAGRLAGRFAGHGRVAVLPGGGMRRPPLPLPHEMLRDEGARQRVESPPRGHEPRARAGRGRRRAGRVHPAGLRQGGFRRSAQPARHRDGLLHLPLLARDPFAPPVAARPREGPRRAQARGRHPARRAPPGRARRHRRHRRRGRRGGGARRRARRHRAGHVRLRFDRGRAPDPAERPFRRRRAPAALQDRRRHRAPPHRQAGPGAPPVQPERAFRGLSAGDR